MSGTRFELWDFESANLVGSYDDQEEAFGDVRDDVRNNGRESALSLVLMRSLTGEKMQRVAAGADLIKLATDSGPGLAYIGIGLYNIRDAALIIHATSQELRRWLNRDKYQVRGKVYRRTPFVDRMLPEDPDVVTFAELMQLGVIRDLRKQGVPMRRIRSTATALARQWGTPLPFASVRFRDEARTAGGYIYFETPSGSVHTAGVGQFALPDVVGPLLQLIDYSAEGDALRYWPRTRDGRVVLDAERQFGQPMDAPTGVPTRVLYVATKANPSDSEERIAQWYKVPVEAVRSAVEYEDSLAA